MVPVTEDRLKDISGSSIVTEYRNTVKGGSKEEFHSREGKKTGRGHKTILLIILHTIIINNNNNQLKTNTKATTDKKERSMIFRFL